jgi:cyclopropane-fatty-acyl-phospholipid synthase
VTTTTISREQYEYACARVQQEGLEDRVTLLFEDYRSLEGEYDKLVSIEMIEAVGYQYYMTFFRQCARMLKPEGMMLLQTITIADQRYEQAKRAVDFIQRYIFPGGCLPSVTALCHAMTEASDLRVFQLEDIGPHYATTIRHWRERFLAHSHKVRDLGYTDEFMRMWEFYLGYCEGAFMERAIANMQMLLVKPWCRREALVPAL